MLRPLPLLLALLLATPAFAAPPATAPRKPTLAVLPFIPAATKDKDLAEDFRRRVSGKATTSDFFDRKDNVEIDSAVSALGVLTTEPYSDEDLAKILATVSADYTLVATVDGRQVSATLYKGKEKSRSTVVTIPGGKDSPKMALEQIWKDLLPDQVTFARVRDKEVDHSDPAAEKRFAEGKNLAPDPGFESASPTKPAADWGAILGSDRYAPPLITAAAAKTLAKDRVAIIPKSAAPTLKGLPEDADARNGQCLMMRMSKNTAESNGLACESIWIPVEHGKKYRFSVMYHSTGPTPRLFLKGFAEKPDQFGDKSDPEATRREYYRMQILPRKKNDAWELIEADFTPSVTKPTDPKIQWLRLDLYIYLGAGDVFFDDVTLKKLDP